MSGLPWFKCYPRDFNDGMTGLTLEERGAYVTILNLIYSRGGPIPEDDWWITSQLGCTRRTWVKVRAALILKRKLYPVNYNGADCLMNARAAQEIAQREELSEKFSEAGARGGRNSQAKRSKNKGRTQGRLDEGSSLDQAIQKSDTDTEAPDVSNDTSHPPKTAPKQAKTRNDYLPASWAVSEALYQFGHDRGLSRQEIDDAADEFRDYWGSRRDAKARRGNWDLTFKSNLRWAANRHGGPRPRLAVVPGGRAGGGGRGAMSFADIYARRHGPSQD